jgi:hypothetical protein
MGLWLKCPGCQASNPLSLKVCPHCGRDLDKLSAKQRVYVIGPATAPPAPSPASAKAVAPAASKSEEKRAAGRPKTPEPEASPAAKAAKKPKGTRKKPR